MARVRLGGLPQAMEALRDQRGLPWLDDLRTDVRVGLRGLARRAGFTATAALTLSIGIGATVAVASVANALLFRPLPVAAPDERARRDAGRRLHAVAGVRRPCRAAKADPLATLRAD